MLKPALEVALSTILQLLYFKSSRQILFVPKTDSPLFIRAKPPETSNSKQKMSMDLPYLWKTLRLVNPAQQVHPRFAGWIISTLKIPHSVHTVLTYLPPIQIPITDF